MRLRRTFNYHHLKKGRVRATWNKYNLYNLSKVERTIPNFIRRTFFQQKWTAKALTRAYHGEHIRESKWNRMFSRRLQSVVNMDPVYMALNDGSEQATGRGSGRDIPRAEDETPWHERGQKRKHNVKGLPLPTPYMNMTFAPLERRIDVAIFRALFASSSRQARQFVIHGAVKVNGQVVGGPPLMTHPSYLLNPGDMFQVDPDMVMYATGRKKHTHVETKEGKPPGTDEEAEEPEDAAEGSEEAAAEDSAEADAAKAAPETDKEQVAKQLKVLSKMAKGFLQAEKGDLSVKKKQQIRSFVKEARNISSQIGRKDGQNAVTNDIVGTINSMLKELVINDPNAATRAKQSGAFSAEATAQAMSDEEASRLAEMVREYEENPLDESKPYLTPWQPRRFMSPFAFIPRYLEVNQNICAAVYLRHPVARQGYAEVPSPFPPNVMQLAFNWYLRRR
ncbi:alpha-L RNA-binding motif-containing protein [Cryphonectria parasitica EP155]|uniref:Alpha-L RNA-binding motif-containing protein n=1 Tax=Cryphonectria parasitica (strain ATCC 38755 / EP155) TaxID=660469 RepID=A0A9P4Y7L2_CRYP1|nr:alpha-L RNA-binding motif-containing protein [Cryphonectria parasitica EP155]KAF3767565.1 alpha-L RNA-binding motif-containing protein [Cryphonectria parasitica EP155]